MSHLGDWQSFHGLETELASVLNTAELALAEHVGKQDADPEQLETSIIERVKSLRKKMKEMAQEIKSTFDTGDGYNTSLLTGFNRSPLGVFLRASVNRLGLLSGTLRFYIHLHKQFAARRAKAAIFDFDETLIPLVAYEDARRSGEKGDHEKQVSFDLFDGTLSKIKKLGVKTAIASNAPRNDIELVLKDENRLRFFDEVKHGNGYQNPKAEVVKDILRRFGTSPEETLFVDDNPEHCEQVAKETGVAVYRVKGPLAFQKVKNVREKIVSVCGVSL